MAENEIVFYRQLVKLGKNQYGFTIPKAISEENDLEEKSMYKVTIEKLG